MDLVTDTKASSLLERDLALKMVAALVEDVLSGAGRVGVVEAGAGLGKTAFLDACARGLTAAGVRLLAARGSELEHDFPYAIVRQLLASVRRPQQLRQAVLAGPAAAAAVLFAEVPPAGEEHETEPFQIMNALYWAIANLCDLGPVAILVDDAHEADDASIGFLAFLARRLDDLPVLLLAATRPAGGRAGAALASALREAADVVTVSLQPLSPGAVGTVLEHSLGSQPGSDFVAACSRATGGNPFYLSELVRSVTDEDLAADAAAVERLAELGPDTIVQRLTSRLAALPEGAVPIARACAVLGEGARLPTVARVADISLDDAAVAADALVREGILAPGPFLAFLHPILQAAVLSELGSHSRARWHSRAARILDEDGFPPELVALHLMRTEPGGDAHVRETLVRAGRAAARGGSPAVAAQYLTRALEESAGEPDAELRYELGLAQASVGDQAGLAHMAAGVAATSEPRDRALRAIRLANFQMRSGDLVEAVRGLDNVRKDLAQLPDIAHDDELLLTVDAYRYWAGRLHPQTREQAMALAEQLRGRLEGPDSPARRTLLAYLACEAAQSESAASAREYFAAALAPPGLLSFVAFDAVATQASLLSLASIEQSADFDELTDRVLVEAGRRGAVLPFLVVSTFRALVMWHRGELAAAETESREALRAAREQGWRRGAIGLMATQALALLGQGELAAAEQALADTASVDIPPGFPTALLLLARGRLAAARGDLHHGLADLLSCGQTLEHMRITSPGVLPWRSQAAEVLAQLGEFGNAAQLAQEELELARRLAGPIATGRALYALAGVARGSERVELLEQARQGLAETSGRLTLAAVSIDLGAALRQDKRVAEARARLTEGLELAAVCRAAPLVARAREELTVLGVQPRRAHRYGPEALTPSELRVARLAAAGRSNAEIAQQLFVTRKTVEKHLASTYRKLEIQSRAELADARLADATFGE